MEAARLFDQGPLRFFPAPLREPRRVWLTILVGWALSFGGSLLLSLAADALAPDLGKPEFGLEGPVAFLLLTVFAPVVETMIMAGVLSLLARLMSPTAAVISSSILWGIAHSLQAPVWGLVIWWPFLIFSMIYLVWRQRGVWVGIGVAAATHALQNLGPGLFVAFGK